MVSHSGTKQYGSVGSYYQSSTVINYLKGNE